MKISINGTRTEGYIEHALTLDTVGPEEVCVRIGDQWILVSTDDLRRALTCITQR